MTTTQDDVSKELHDIAIKKNFFKSYRGIGLNRVQDEADEEKAGISTEEQFKTKEVDYEVARKQKINPFKSSLLDIGHRSEGLAGYVLTVRFMIAVMCIHSLLSIYSMWDYSTNGTAGGANTFELQLIGSDGRVLYQETCPKYWKAQTSFSKFSLGAFCQRNSSYTSPMTCAAKCTRKISPGDAYATWLRNNRRYNPYEREFFAQPPGGLTYDDLYPDDRATSVDLPLTATSQWASSQGDLSAVTDPEGARNIDRELLLNTADLLGPSGKCLANSIEAYGYYITNGRAAPPATATMLDRFRRLVIYPFTTVAELYTMKRFSKINNAAAWTEPRGDLTLAHPLTTTERDDVIAERIEQLLGYDRRTTTNRTLLLLEKLQTAGLFANVSSSLCWTALPCIGSLDHGPESPDGACRCCDLEPLQASDSSPASVEDRIEHPFNMWMQLL